jgi:hypothetical protein
MAAGREQCGRAIAVQVCQWQDDRPARDHHHLLAQSAQLLQPPEAEPVEATEDDVVAEAVSHRRMAR